MVNRVLGAWARVRSPGVIDSDVGVYPTSLAYYRELVPRAAVGSEIEGGNDALVDFRCVLMLAGRVVRRRLWASSLGRRMIGEDVGSCDLGIEGEEVLAELGSSLARPSGMESHYFGGRSRVMDAADEASGGEWM